MEEVYEKDQSRTESLGPDVTGGFVCGWHRESSHAVLQSQSRDGVLQEPGNALLSFQQPQITNKRIALDSPLHPKAGIPFPAASGKCWLKCASLAFFAS